MGNFCCCDFEDQHTIRYASSKNNNHDQQNNTTTTTNQPGGGASSSQQHPQNNPKFQELAEKTKRQLEKSIHVLIVSCASDLGEEVLRILFAELYRAVQQISSEFYYHSSSSTATTTTAVLIDDVRSFLDNIFKQAEKDSFIVVEQDRTKGRRMQIEDYRAAAVAAASSSPSKQNDVLLLSSQNNKRRRNLEDFRAGGGTFGDEISATTSLAGFNKSLKERKKKEAEAETNKKNNSKRSSAANNKTQEELDEEALAAFEEEMLGAGDNKNEDPINGRKTTRILRIWEDSRSIALQRYFRPVHDRVQLLKIWILGDKICSGSMPIENVTRLLEVAGKENTYLVSTSGDSAVGDVTALFSVAERGDRLGSTWTPALHPPLHVELADRLVTHLNRLTRRVLNPISSINFADLWVSYQEHGFWYPELEHIWDVASEAARTRSRLAAEKMAEEVIKENKKNNGGENDDDEDDDEEENDDDDYDGGDRSSAPPRRRKKKKDNRNSAKSSSSALDNIQSSPEFLEALSSLPENVLTRNDLMQFLLLHQKHGQSDPRPGESLLKMSKTRRASFSSAKARKEAELILESVGGYCSKEAFVRYLTDPILNPVLNPAAREGITHNMTLPITNYFIASSYKTFLKTDRSKNIPDESMYQRVLQEGCRCVELEIWETQDGNTKKLVVYHNNVSSSGDSSPNSKSNNNKNSSPSTSTATLNYQKVIKLPLRTVLETINQSAFVRSSYPLIVFLDIHVYDTSMQEQLAKDLQHAFGTSLKKPTWKPGEFPSGDVDFSPDSMTNKILLMSKRSQALMTKRDSDRALALDARAMINKLHTPAFAGQTFDVKKNQQLSKSGEPALVIPESLLSLLFFDTVGGMIDLSKPVPPNVFAYHCTQLEEQKCLGTASRYQKQCIKVTSRQLVNVFPESSRINCTNYHPQYFWNAGIQLCSTNWQDGGLESRLYKKRFMMDNGNCGYLKKPNFMILENHNNNNNTDNNSNNNSQRRFLNLSSSQEDNNRGGGDGEDVSEKTYTFKLSMEFLSALHIPSVCAVQQSTTSQRTIYRPVRDPYLLVYLEGPFLEGRSVQEKKLLLYQPSMLLTDSDEDNFQRVFSPQLLTQFRNYSVRHYLRGDSQLRGSVSDGTHHAVFRDLVNEAILDEVKRVTAGRRVYSTSSAAASNQALKRFVREPKNILEINVPVPELSTLVVQLIDGGSASPVSASSSNNNNNTNGSGSSPTATTGSNSAASFNKSDPSFRHFYGSATEETINNKNKIILAETFLPVHLLQSGVRCVPLHDPNSYPSLSDLPETRLLVKIEKQQESYLPRDVLFSDDVLYELGKGYLEREGKEKELQELRKTHGDDLDDDELEMTLDGTVGDLQAMLLGKKRKNKNKNGKNENDDENPSHHNPLKFFNDAAADRNNNNKQKKIYNNDDDDLAAESSSYLGPSKKDGNDDENQQQVSTISGRKSRVSIVRKNRPSIVKNNTNNHDDDLDFNLDDLDTVPIAEESTTTTTTTTTTNTEDSNKKKYHRPRGNTTVDDFFTRISAEVDNNNNEQLHSTASPAAASSTKRARQVSFATGTSSNKPTTTTTTTKPKKAKTQEEKDLEKMLWGSGTDFNLEDFHEDSSSSFSSSATHHPNTTATATAMTSVGGESQQQQKSQPSAGKKDEDDKLFEQTYERALLDFLGNEGEDEEVDF